MRAVGIIPARYAAQRLPGKPLRRILGKPLVQWVWEAAAAARELQRVVIATDDERIARRCREFGAEVVFVPEELPSGSDRVARAYELLGERADLVLNIQGDEPLLQPQHLDRLVQTAAQHGDWDVVTLVQPLTHARELQMPSVVKVALRSDGTALYFSRAPIPYIVAPEAAPAECLWKHVGVYAFRPAVLQAFVALPPGRLEQCERLEQLRLLEAGYLIGCVVVREVLHAVDVPADLRWVRRYWARQARRKL